MNGMAFFDQPGKGFENIFGRVFFFIESKPGIKLSSLSLKESKEMIGALLEYE